MYVQFCDGKELWYYFCRCINGESKDSIVSESDRIFKELLDNAETMDKLIDLRRKMTDEEFVRTLEKFAVFEIYVGDLLKIFSRVNNVVYENWWLIKTTTKYDLFIIATSEFVYDSNHYYTVDEINKLVVNNSIIVISEQERINFSKITDFKLKYCQWAKDAIENRTEECDTFNPIVYDKCMDPIYWLDEYFVKSEGKYYDAVIKYIRKNPARNSRLKEELEEYINSIDMGLVDIYDHIRMISVIDKDMWDYSEKKQNLEILTACLDNFNSKGYVKRLESLKEKYPNYGCSSYVRNYRK